MPVPPPPPPPPPPSGGPPPPPPPVSSELPKLQKDEQKARNALLADIQQGTRLRKVTQINDRSAPQIEKPKGTNRDGVSPAANKGGSQQPLGGLFAGGFPVLRPAGQRDMPDDFESKFTFHSVEDFPPPDEFKPFQKIYPSKIARDCNRTALPRTGMPVILIKHEEEGDKRLWLLLRATSY
ncbi:UNVERIFIED_CONTAM: hypothetical protein H355_011650 [Colinus virginianus]|nr:hypothetical protein H355_011650 [Colinus virginianus]